MAVYLKCYLRVSGRTFSISITALESCSSTEICCSTLHIVAAYPNILLWHTACSGRLIRLLERFLFSYLNRIATTHNRGSEAYQKHFVESVG